MRVIISSICFGIICFALSCKSTKELGSLTRIPKKLDKTISVMEENEPQYKKLTISGKAVAEIPDQGVDIKLSYRVNIVKDSVVWIRISKLGIEAVRILVTLDSVFVLDNINERFVRSGFDPARKFTGLDVDFALLQDLILGNLNIIPKRFNLEKEAENPDWLQISGTEAGTAFSYAIEKKWLKLKQIKAFNPIEQQQTEITYGDFQKQGKGIMPQSGKVRVTLPEKISLDFSHSRVRINPEKISLKFNVPKGYTSVSR